MATLQAILLACLAFSTPAWATPAPPTRLLVDYLPGSDSWGDASLVSVVSTLRPHFSFVPEDPATAPPRGSAMSAYRIVVRVAGSSTTAVGGSAAVGSSTTATAAWDSGKVAATSAVAIPCGAALLPGTAYAWTATWWDHTGAPSAATSSTFDTGLVAEADWKGAPWLGGAASARELRLTFNATLRGGKAVARARLYVASPGGVVVTVNGAVAGDRAGLSAWINFDKRVMYETRAIESLLLGGRDGRGSSSSSNKTDPGDGRSGNDKDDNDDHHHHPVSTTGTAGAAAAHNEIVLSLGCGFWEGNQAAVSVRAESGVGSLKHPTTCSSPMVRALIVLEAEDGSREYAHADGGPLATLPLQTAARPGGILEDSPFIGTTIDWKAAEASDWTVPAASPKASSVPKGKLFPLSTPLAATTKKGIAPSTVTALPGSGGKAWHIVFPANIVGITAIAAGSFSGGNGGGNITIQHCERLNANKTTPTCILLSGLEAGVTDVHILPSDSVARKGGGVQAGTDLRPRFTWHGFQHAIVTVSGDATFDPKGFTAHWSMAALEGTGSMSFSDDGGGALLTQLHDMVTVTQRANMAAYVPTDCPTREKHGWLGDAQVTAEESMYSLFTPTVHAQFLAMIRDDQIFASSDAVSTSSLNSGVASIDVSAFNGFIPGVVPGVVQKPGDISWTAAYPLIAHWMMLYYGDTATARDHWPNLKAWADGAAREVKAAGKWHRDDNLPDFFVWGDWCAVESRAVATPGTGPQAAASNYLLSLDAIVSMADALGETSDAAKYRAVLAEGRAAYEARYWNATAESWVGARPELEHQTLTSLALTALPDGVDGVNGVGGRGDVDGRGGAGGAEVAATGGAGGRRALAAEALAKDVMGRGGHLTIGSAGAAVLLQSLSENGQHDVAVQLATQTSYPGWGWWVGQGATTCWESWSGVADASHPPPPTHNHIFLCAGLGEWMYSSMGGIRPAANGYANITIAPHVSKNYGPSAVNASVMTVRGLVESSWVRYGGSSDSGGDSGERGQEQDQERVVTDVAHTNTSGSVFLRLRVRVPTGVHATVRLPLLGRRASKVRVRCTEEKAAEGGGVAGAVSSLSVWPSFTSPPSSVARLVAAGVDGVETAVMPGGEEEVVVAVRAGAYVFHVEE